MKRSGEIVSAGDSVDYAAAAPEASGGSLPATVSISAWDGVPRFTSSRHLYDLPLAVIVGLAEDEQVASFRRRRGTYLSRAGAGTVL